MSSPTATVIPGRWKDDDDDDDDDFDIDDDDDDDDFDIDDSTTRESDGTLSRCRNRRCGMHRGRRPTSLPTSFIKRLSANSDARLILVDDERGGRGPTEVSTLR